MIYDLLNIVHDAVIVTDYFYSIIFINNWAKIMFNTHNNELIGIHIENIFPREDREILVTNILKMTKEKQGIETEAMLQRIDGISFPGSVTASFFSLDGKNKGISFTIHDLTHVKSIEKALEKSERITFLGTLINNISHQIRNPITVIGGFARRFADKEPCSTSTEAILKETNRLEELLEGLDNLISLPKPRPRKVQLITIKKAIEKLFLQRVGPQGIDWKITSNIDIIEQSIFIDQSLILQALEAIIINACEACVKTKKKSILFEIINPGDRSLPFVFKITDSGIGISETNLQFIFNIFYSNKTNHIGMGLTLSQRIIEEQGGSISIDSIVGQGTTVTIHLMQERRRSIRTTRLT